MVAFKYLIQLSFASIALTLPIQSIHKNELQNVEHTIDYVPFYPLSPEFSSENENEITVEFMDHKPKIIHKYVNNHLKRQLSKLYGIFQQF